MNSRCARNPSFSLLALSLSFPMAMALAAQSGEFTRLKPVIAPKIVSSAEAYPGGRYKPRNLTDGATQTEYASNSKGTNTFVEFDFGVPISISAFQHIDRNDPATVARSELVFMDATGKELVNFAVQHVNQRGGSTFQRLPSPVTAQRARWQVTQLGSTFSTVGGAEISFFTTGETETTPKGIALESRSLQLLERHEGAPRQLLKVSIDYPYAEPLNVRLQADGAEARELQLKFGNQTLELGVPAVTSEKLVKLQLTAGALGAVASKTVVLQPVRKLEVYLLPHSHVDIGYTALQADVEKKQDSNLETGMRLARDSRGYPEDARFKWNVEVLWPVDNYLRTATPQQRAEFFAAVKSGEVGLDALYGNTLTGLCRPEELINLMRFATRLSQMCGVPVESAMISDVPGYTWSTITAMAQAGVKYFSFAPNYFDRMGGTMKEWQNRPFWWRSPDNRHRVLCWCPSRGYALGHIIGDGEALARFMPDYLFELETNKYPYEITHLRWNVHGDNGSPDEKLSDVVRDWNKRYVYPRLIISTTAKAFRAFEQRYGSKLPEFSGDYTPYWEDGAASSTLETAMNRASAERLVQAEALWAIRNPGTFPAAAFQDAWRNILLYSEHTWGAHNSISEPDVPFVKDQWKVKQEFAIDADKQSRALLAQALSNGKSEPDPGKVEVYNTCSWSRTDAVTLAPAQSAAGDRVLSEDGKAVPSQRLSTGELVFLAKDVPAFGAKRFQITAGACPPGDHLNASGNTLSSRDFVLRIDENSGAISSLFSKSLNRELAEQGAHRGLNDYLYLPGSDLQKLKRNAKPTIKVKENGPLIGSLLVECDAPGCKKLSREIRVINGVDRVEVINLVDKLPIREKEGIHFGYAFDVPNGMPRFDVGLAAVRPEIDQIPAACKNWFSVQRWVDISNDKFGVTWSPIDAPLVELGDITANLVGSQTDWRVWVQHLKPSSRIYSWAMNNHWHTNYRADQEGPTTFRYAIRAHKAFAGDESARFGIECSQPLIAMPAAAAKQGPSAPRVKLSTDKVQLITLKPSDDGKGEIVRLFGASGKDQKVKLTWSDPVPKQVYMSGTSEKAGAVAGNSITVPGWGLVTLRAE